MPEEIHSLPWSPNNYPCNTVMLPRLEQFTNVRLFSSIVSAGVGRTGVFVALSIVLERMRFEGVVDMFQTVNMLRQQRPAMVQSEVGYSAAWRSLCRI